MSPEIEWQIGDEVGDEIVVTSPPTPRHWQSGWITLMIIFGAALGAIYSSIRAPEPTPPPTIAPTPEPPEDASKVYEHLLSLEKTIDVEAQAVANGDLNTFLSVQDQLDERWFQSQRNSFRAWGRPSANDPRFSKLYFYVETLSTKQPRDRAVVDIRQYRNGVYFRETRFYRLDTDQWVRTRPDPSYWSGQTALGRTAHFDLTFPVEDELLVDDIAVRFESVYQRLCGDLNCPNNFRVSVLHLVVDPRVDHISSYGGLPVTMTLPSPRVIGLTEQSIGSDQAALDRYDAFTLSAYEELAMPATLIAAGGVNRWSKTNDGQLFAQAIALWESVRLQVNASFASPYHKPASSAELQQLLPLASLESLWTISPDASFFSDAQRLKRREQTRAVIAFIAEKFGAASVIKFLNAFATEKTLPQIVHDTFDVTYSDFEQEWLKWLEPNN